MQPIQIISQDLFDKIRSRFSNLEMGDQTGAVTIDPTEARFFDFDFVIEGVNLGRVSMSLNDLGSLKIYYSQGITENQDDPVKKEWYGFLKEMRFFAMRRLLRFDTRDIAKTNLDKKDFQHLATTQGSKEEDMTNMNESKWNHKSSKKTSRAVKGQTEVIMRHVKPVDEEYAGSRSQRKNIKAIFIQNKDGERFKYPFIHTAGAFAMAQHVDHGGIPHDPAGKAIIKMSEEMAQLAEFKNKVRSASLHDDAHNITERAIGRLNELRAQIEALGKRQHYEAWAENFNEQEYMDTGLEMDEVAMEEYKQKFTQTSFQEELSGYFPLLHRIMGEANKIDLEQYVSEDVSSEFTVCANDGTYEIEKFPSLDDAMEYIEASFRDDPDSRQMDYSIKDSTGNTVWTHDEDHDLGYDAYKERGWSQEGAFEEWAESVEQGTLTDDQVNVIKQELSILPQGADGLPELELGPNGTTAWQFFNELGIEDTDLEDMFSKMADIDDTTNATEVFQKWGQSNYPELLVALGMSAEEPAEEPETLDNQQENGEAGGPANNMMSKESVIKEVAKIVKSFYNRDNPEVGPFRGQDNIALDAKKKCTEMFGEEIGEQAEQLATQFMEKLSNEWEQRHGKVEDDGMARLKELLNRVKGKVESIGDVGGHPGKNIMSAEENRELDPPEFDSEVEETVPVNGEKKKPIQIPGQKGVLPDVAPNAVKSLDKKQNFWNRTFEGDEGIAELRRFSGLAK